MGTFIAGRFGKVCKFGFKFFANRGLVQQPSGYRRVPVSVAAEPKGKGHEMSCARTLLGSPQVPLANVTLISELRRYAHLNPVCVSRYGLEKPEQMLNAEI